jgi:hypothetical protein
MNQYGFGLHWRGLLGAFIMLIMAAETRPQPPPARARPLSPPLGRWPMTRESHRVKHFSGIIWSMASRRGTWRMCADHPTAG